MSITQLHRNSNSHRVLAEIARRGGEVTFAEFVAVVRSNATGKHAVANLMRYFTRCDLVRRNVRLTERGLKSVEAAKAKEAHESPNE